MSSSKLKNLFSTRLTFSSTCDLINSYRALCADNNWKPTFAGLLSHCYLTYEEYLSLCESENLNDRKVAKILTLFKQDLEAVLEQKLLYQDNLPKFYDKKVGLELLKSMNPKRFAIENKVNVIQEKFKAKEIEFKNVSGHSLELENKSS